ncbi:MAG: S-methyl-5'-thioadenosine phosphorylase [Candidatus Diapherotrites archaeon]|nr:S-methyl-5'-thioadenosine phosphorylase [Candidatus Diapherotrites archaeon]
MIGIIGGSGLEDPEILTGFEEKKVKTPYGEPSSQIAIGKIGGQKVAILSRHGKKHSITPSNVNFRANIWALKELGVKQILATSACGSLREKMSPGNIVFPDQFIDWTKKREATFFDQDKVAHIPLAEPFCPVLRKALLEASEKLGLKAHWNGTVITIEGPRFSTRAESSMFRLLNADVINMSTVPECVLAREAGICYQVACLVTDYDSWHLQKEHVSVEMVVKVMKTNAENAKKLFMQAIPKIAQAKKTCSCEKDISKAFI